MVRRKGRGLTPDDQALWDRVAKTAKPLERPAKPALHQSTAKPATAKTPKAPVAYFEVGQRAPAKSSTADLAPSLREQFDAAPVQMDKRAFGKLKRGKLQPEARIDLHGLTLDRAHPRLIGFISSAHAEGKRLVLVITGKGKSKPQPGPIPTRIGVLRHQVPQWLNMAPLRPLVLQVTPAHLRHGGEGAYYVYLRRR